MARPAVQHVIENDKCKECQESLRTDELAAEAHPSLMPTNFQAFAR